MYSALDADPPQGFSLREAKKIFWRVVGVLSEASPITSRDSFLARLLLLSVLTGFRVVVT
jgi:hypothetical protein